MTVQLIIKKISFNKDVFLSLFKGIEEEQILWRPAENKWCILEIAGHLLDEEREDFKQRIEYTLYRPGAEWPKIDPEKWVQSHNYLKNNYTLTVRNFIKEREKSVKWLLNIQNNNWEKSHMHPVLGKMTAGLLLANWLAHDYFHIRQINRYNYEYLQQKSAIDLNYAGKW
jgi:hypothetical protein